LKKAQNSVYQAVTGLKKAFRQTKFVVWGGHKQPWQTNYWFRQTNL